MKSNGIMINCGVRGPAVITRDLIDRLPPVFAYSVSTPRADDFVESWLLNIRGEVIAYGYCHVDQWAGRMGIKSDDETLPPQEQELFFEIHVVLQMYYPTGYKLIGVPRDCPPDEFEWIDFRGAIERRRLTDKMGWKYYETKKVGGNSFYNDVIKPSLCFDA